MPPHADRAAGTLRSPGERLRRHRFQRTRSHRRIACADGARADAGDRRDALSADADHVVVRGVRRERPRPCRARATRRSPGIHMEGPYLSPEDGPRGAHPRAARVAASVDDFKRRQDAAGGRIVLVTLAPEVPARWRSSSISSPPACASRSATRRRRRNRSRDAIAAGATLATHLGNGCAQMLPRHPNVIWEQLAADARLREPDRRRPSPAAGDGEGAWCARRVRGRTILVTDAIAAAGCAPGRYTIGGVDVRARRRTAASSLPGHAVSCRLRA